MRASALWLVYLAGRISPCDPLNWKFRFDWQVSLKEDLKHINRKSTQTKKRKKTLKQMSQTFKLVSPRVWMKTSDEWRKMNATKTTRAENQMISSLLKGRQTQWKRQNTSGKSYFIWQRFLSFIASHVNEHKRVSVMKKKRTSPLFHWAAQTTHNPFLCLNKEPVSLESVCGSHYLGKPKIRRFMTTA